MSRVLDRVAQAVAPLVAAAVVLALVAPSRALARHSDLLLAGLVATVALAIDPAALAALRRRWATLLRVVLLPYVALAVVGFALSRGFAGATRDGVLCLGLSSSEVATVGLATLAGADAALALGAVMASLVLAVLAGPPVIAAAGDGAHASAGALLGRFALVVLVPLALGQLVRALRPAVARAEPAFGAAGAVIVAALVYAALSGVSGAHDLGTATLAAVLFLVLGAAVAFAVGRVVSRADRAATLLTAGLRDFAVAAAIAAQAFGPRAATVAGVYGVAMLLVGAVAASALRRRGGSQMPAGA
jgi:BASS family bile acid:Na+ symporter